MLLSNGPKSERTRRISKVLFVYLNLVPGSLLFILDAMTAIGCRNTLSNILVKERGGSQTLVGFALQGVQECWHMLAGANASPGSSLMGEKVGLKNSLQTRGHKTRSVGADEHQSWASSSAKLQDSKDSGTGWRLRLRSCACQEVSKLNNPFNLKSPSPEAV